MPVSCDSGASTPKLPKDTILVNFLSARGQPHCYGRSFSAILVLNMIICSASNQSITSIGPAHSSINKPGNIDAGPPTSTKARQLTTPSLYNTLCSSGSTCLPSTGLDGHEKQQLANHGWGMWLVFCFVVPEPPSANSTRGPKQLQLQNQRLRAPITTGPKPYRGLTWSSILLLLSPSPHAMPRVRPGLLYCNDE